MKNAEVTVVIHTHNEAINIRACIESARSLTDTVIVIDMESTDETHTIAAEMGAEVYEFPFRSYVEPAREYGIKKVMSTWVFIMDADERITPSLAKEIHDAIILTEHTYYTVPRKNIFAHTWLRHGGWWPDSQIRLLRKDSFTTWPTAIHSTPQINGTMGQLQSPLLHYFHGVIETMVSKTIVYEEIESELLYEARKDASTPIFFRKFFGELYRRMLKHWGFLDGTIGIVESIYQAFSKTITYLYLYEKKKSSAL